MPKRTFTHVVTTLAVVAVIATLTSCGAPSPAQTNSGQEIGPVTPIAGEPGTTSSDSVPPEVDSVRIRREPFTSLEELISADLIIEGTIAAEMTRRIPDATSTNVELAERQARGEQTDRIVTEYEVTIDRVLKGQVNSKTVTVIPAGAAASVQVGNRVILFLVDISGGPFLAPDQTKYGVIAPEGQFRVEKDNTLFADAPPPRTLTESYRGKDKSVLEKDIFDLVAQLPKPTKEEILQKALSGYSGADLVIEGTIQGIREVHFINSLEKPQEWIDQMLAEGKMPGLVLTDYAIVVDKVLSDKRIHFPRFFPNYKPIEPGQTIIVTRQGGTYKGVTKIEEPGPPFEIGSQEVLFLVGFSLTAYDVPDDGQVRYSTDSRMGRFLIGPDNTLTAFTTKGLGGIYGGQDVGQLEQDIAEFLKTQPPN